MMKARNQRIVLEAADPLFRRAHPILLELFAQGVLRTSSKQLVMSAALTILLSPVGWLVAIAGRGVHIAIVLGLWWFLQAELNAFGVPSNLALTAGVIAVLYKDLYQELLDMTLYIVIILTGSGFLRWMCSGYLSQTGFRQYAMVRDPMSRVVGVMINVVEPSYRRKYEEIMRLYLASNDREAETQLNTILNSYLESDCQAKETRRVTGPTIRTLPETVTDREHR